MSDIIEQLRRLQEIGEANRKSTKELIEAAQKIRPDIKTRGEALELVEEIKRGRGLKP